MDLFSELVDIFLHLDQHLEAWSAAFGPWIYPVLFLIVFCETGLVVTPFLPGDSLLFAAGALAALEGSGVSVAILILTLTAAAVLGDAVNYAIGRRIGPRVFRREDSWLFNKRHLLRTQQFYERHGGKTIVLARFMPIFRTFAPFVAGIGRMGYRRFSLFNVTGAVAWVVGFVLAGRWFGGIPMVKRNFHVVILIIIVISCIPPAIEYLRARAAARLGAAAAE